MTHQSLLVVLNTTINHHYQLPLSTTTNTIIINHVLSTQKYPAQRAIQLARTLGRLFDEVLARDFGRTDVEKHHRFIGKPAQLGDSSN